MITGGVGVGGVSSGQYVGVCGGQGVVILVAVNMLNTRGDTPPEET